MAQKKTSEDQLVPGIPDGPITNPADWTKTSLNIRKDLLKLVKMKVLEEDTTVTDIVIAFLKKYVGKD